MDGEQAHLGAEGKIVLARIFFEILARHKELFEIIHPSYFKLSVRPFLFPDFMSSASIWS
jgi:hypothetical protein